MASPDERFPFGENWQRFLAVVDDSRREQARRSLLEMLEMPSVAGASFLDIGCGSGLFSLAAVELGCARVHSFDLDAESVACARELKRRCAPDASHWTIAPGSALDPAAIAALGPFDIVYSWGVLHHSGDMFGAFENVHGAVAPGGRLCLSIYNDQGFTSRMWRAVKRTYNALPRSLRTPFVVAVMAPRELRFALVSLARLRPQEYVRSWTEYRRHRGMSRWHDLVDWTGGYPFEVAKPEAVFAFFRDRGFRLVNLTTCAGGLGCNEFVFVREAAAG